MIHPFDRAVAEGRKAALEREESPWEEAWKKPHRFVLGVPSTAPKKCECLTPSLRVLLSRPERCGRCWGVLNRDQVWLRLRALERELWERSTSYQRKLLVPDEEERNAQGDSPRPPAGDAQGDAPRLAP